MYYVVLSDFFLINLGVGRSIYDTGLAVVGGLAKWLFQAWYERNRSKGSFKRFSIV